MTDSDCYDIAGFCESHSISRSMFDKLVKSGKGPRIIKVGRKTLISREAAAEWRAAREADNRQ